MDKPNQELQNYSDVLTTVLNSDCIEDAISLLKEYIEHLNSNFPDTWQFHLKEFRKKLMESLHNYCRIRQVRTETLEKFAQYPSWAQEVKNIQVVYDYLMRWIEPIPEHNQILSLLDDLADPTYVFYPKVGLIDDGFEDFEDRNPTEIEMDTTDIKKERGNKIPFLGTPAQFGYMMKLFVETNFAELPKRKKGADVPSWRAYAKQCYDSYYIMNQDGTGETSFENIYNEILKPSLTEGGKSFIKLKDNK